MLASTSYGTAVAIRESDGSLWTWGSDHLGDGLWSKEVDKPTKLEGTSGFIGVAAGSRHVLALRDDGTVWGWGDNKSGQLGFKEDGFVQGDSYNKVQLIPKQNPVLKNIVSIAAGVDISAALDANGHVWVWGSASGGDGIMPKNIITDTHIVNVRAGGWNGVVALLKDNGDAVVFAGKNGFLDENSRFEVGNGKLGMAGRVVDMSFDGNSFFALSEYGHVYSYGSNTMGDLGLGDIHDRKTFSMIKSFGRINLLGYGIAVDDVGRIWKWGVNVFNRKSALDFPSNSEPYPRVVSRQPNIIGLGIINRNDFFIVNGTGRVSYFSGGDLALVAAVKTNTWILGD